MHMNKFLAFLGLTGTLAGCNGTMTPRDTWHSEYGSLSTGTPTTMMYGTPATDDASHKMSVLLPLSGENAATGRALRTAIEAAVIQRAPNSLSVTFHDTAVGASTAINTALSENPDVIVGPLFAADARTLRAMKPNDMPAISFTSDASALGNGVMTMALMPSNGVEAIVREMATDGSTGMLILAPESNTGRLMAAAARAAATNNDIPVSGVVFYHERDTESIKNAANAAALYPARSAANKRAREILADVLNTEQLTAIEKSSLSRQLDNISRTETLGHLPYNAVLFLGSADDAKSLASFLRYYGVSARDARFYGTAMWDGAFTSSDITMSGAKYPALSETNPAFVNLYEQTTGTTPNRIASFGYDAANMAMGTIYSRKSNAAYLMDPSGYVGIDGLVRLTPSGASQRALRIMQISGNGAIAMRAAPDNFITQIYSIDPAKLAPARPMTVETPGINPLSYIQIPDRVRGKYKSKTYGANATQSTTTHQENIIAIIPEDDEETVVSNPEFQPKPLETVSRTYIDSVEINE
ncbi:ABC transporter substrate-binding protein [bacterium]|nr:ABC transporter substrate-binding protein [bacterium]